MENGRDGARPQRPRGARIIAVVALCLRSAADARPSRLQAVARRGRSSAPRLALRLHLFGEEELRWPISRQFVDSATSSSRGPRERPLCRETPCACCATPRRTTPRGSKRFDRRGTRSTSRTTSSVTTKWESASPTRFGRRRERACPCVWSTTGSALWAMPPRASGAACARAAWTSRCYNPPRLDQPLGWIGRDHRKCIVVDGQDRVRHRALRGKDVGGRAGARPARVARHRRRGSWPRGGRGGSRLRRHVGGHGRAPASRRDRGPRAPCGGRLGPAGRRVDTGNGRALPPRSPGGLACPPHAVAHRRLLSRARPPTCSRCGRRLRTAST